MNKIKVVTIVVALIVTLNLATTKVWADPSKSHGFADFDDNTEEEQTNMQMRNQELEIQERENNTEAITLSSNNYLKELTVDGYELSPEFSKQTIKYELKNVKDKEIKVEAIKEDDRAEISGTGIVTLKAGENDIQIQVTAENGSVRTYHIKANIEEEKKIENTETTKNNTQNKIIAIVIVAVLAILIYYVIKSKK